MMESRFNNIDYLVYSAQPGKNHTALVVLHGYGVNHANLYPLVQVIKAEADWYFPNGLFPVLPGATESRSWFPIQADLMQYLMEHQEQANYAMLQLEGLVDTLTRLQTFLHYVAESHTRIILAGFSQGAMVLPHLAARCKQVAGFMMFSTNILNLSQLKADITNFLPAKVPFLQTHGTYDAVLSFAQAQKDFDTLRALGYQGEFIAFAGGHEIPLDIYHKIAAFIG